MEAADVKDGPPVAAQAATAPAGRSRRGRRSSRRKRRPIDRALKTALIFVLVFAGTIALTYLILLVMNSGMNFSWLHE